MGRTHVTGVVLLVTLPLLACDGNGTAPQDQILLGTQRVHGLELTLTIDPTTTAPGGSFTATLSITNRRDSAVTMVTGCSELALSAVYRAGDEEPAWFIGASGGCYLVISRYRLDAGETFERVWNVRAATQRWLGGTEYETVLAADGAYLFRVSPNVITIDQESARLPELEGAFRVG